MAKQLRLALIMLLLGAVITLLILFGTSLLIQFNDFSEKQIDIITFVSSLFIFIFIGFISGNIKGKNGLVNGMLSAVLLAVIFAVINILNRSFDFIHIVRYIIMILTGGLGGIIGVNFKPIIKA